MTAREVLDGIKARPFITDETAERLTRAVEAVLSIANDDQPGGQFYIAAIENALNPKEGQ